MIYDKYIHLKEVISIDEVFNQLPIPNSHFFGNIKEIKIGKSFIKVDIKRLIRLLCFKYKGIKCVHCGIEGKYFVKEKRMGEIKFHHLNLYGINKNGKEILINIDHIVPKSKGGYDSLDNYQTMCEPCNLLKSNKLSI